jgi:hypothetical protein
MLENRIQPRQDGRGQEGFQGNLFIPGVIARGKRTFEKADFVWSDFAP